MFQIIIGMRHSFLTLIFLNFTHIVKEKAVLLPLAISMHTFCLAAQKPG